MNDFSLERVLSKVREGKEYLCIIEIKDNQEKYFLLIVTKGKRPIIWVCESKNSTKGLVVHLSKKEFVSIVEYYLDLWGEERRDFTSVEWLKGWVNKQLDFY